MTDENIEQIANTVYELAQKEINDNTNLKRVEKRLKENETQNKNLIDSLKMCNVDSVRQTIFDEIQKMDEERKEIEKELLLEGRQKIDITVPQIKFFLKEMRSGKIDDINYCKMLVNVLISKIYLYDDSITIIFNTQNKPYNEKIPLIEELEEKLGASSYKTRPAQPSQKEKQKFISIFLFVRFYFCIKRCIIKTSFLQRKSLWKEVYIVSSYELIWRLIVLLLLSNNNQEDSHNSQD